MPTSRSPVFFLVVSFFNVPIINGLVSQIADIRLDEWWIDSSVPTASVASNVSEKCLQHTQEFLTALRNRQSWAVKMYESSGRLVEDLIYIEGSSDVHHEPGLFDACVSVQSDGIPFKGQYCTVFFGLKEEKNIGNQQTDFMTPSSNVEDSNEPNESLSDYQTPSVGFCLPSTCSASDLRSALVHRVGHRITKGKKFLIVVNSDETYCYTQEKIDANGATLDNLSLGVLLVFCALGITVVVATMYDIWIIEDRKTSQRAFALQMLHCFSAKKNCTMLFSTEDDAEDSLSCLHGVRILTTCWIVLIHLAGASTFLRLSYNKKMVLQNSLRWEFQFVANGLFGVDTFFLLSGLLVSFTQMRQLDLNRGYFNIKRFYVRRYMRLTPVYAAVLAFLATLWPYIGTGPDWHFVQRISQSVRENFWAQMLYINNYVNPHRFTSPAYGFAESWYLSCDMQMFWISPLFIYPLWRWKRVGFIWTVFCLLLFLGISAMTFIVYDLPPTIIWLRSSELSRIDVYSQRHYMETFARIPPYMIGILLGWLLHKTKDKRIHINKSLIATGWISAAIIGSLVTYGIYPYLDEKTVPIINPFVRVLYGALHHSAWAITVGWIIFACTHGYGGIIHRFLSWKLFLPFSRLSYAVYLIHFNFIRAYASHLRKPFYFTELIFGTTYLGILMIAFFISFAVSVVVEMPFLNLDKLLFPNKPRVLESNKNE
ncbi:nose resistant to fluoxetine protein 6-like isoform X1 [Daphnia carinata]|uniref:nose resistant to fluoxetine protein 6-like isoform X1 n=1 Tax=Daphnia carinata TaxID=120202 RepID=UPI002579C538|nr:nose resistant to fluoxetine protein 6-like isoform X1 [Daphnia carinata]